MNNPEQDLKQHLLPGFQTAIEHDYYIYAERAADENHRRIRIEVKATNVCN